MEAVAPADRRLFRAGWGGAGPGGGSGWAVGVPARKSAGGGAVGGRGRAGEGGGGCGRPASGAGRLGRGRSGWWFGMGCRGAGPKVGRRRGCWRAREGGVGGR